MPGKKTMPTTAFTNLHSLSASWMIPAIDEASLSPCNPVSHFPLQFEVSWLTKPRTGSGMEPHKVNSLPQFIQGRQFACVLKHGAYDLSKNQVPLDFKNVG